jgi:hypothetical protein
MGSAHTRPGALAPDTPREIIEGDIPENALKPSDHAAFSVLSFGSFLPRSREFSP